MPHLRHISPAHSPPPTAHRPPPIQIPNHQQQQQTDKRNNHGNWFVGQRRHFPSEIDGWKLTITREMDRVIDSRPVSSAADRWLWFPRPRKSNFQVSAVQFWGDPISSHLNCCWLSYSWLPAIDSLIIEGRGRGSNPVSWFNTDSIQRMATTLGSLLPVHTIIIIAPQTRLNRDQQLNQQLIDVVQMKWWWRRWRWLHHTGR